jgi:hypothetical protein
MSQTLDQIYIANPSTTVLSTDLFYLVHSPFTPGTDSAITGANLKASLFTVPLTGALGGTGIVNSGLTINLAGGASGLVLTSDSFGNASWHAASAGGITTINGDSGSITGSTVSIIAGLSTLNSGSTVSFINSGTLSTLNLSDNNSNTILGSQAGNTGLTGGANTALGVDDLASCISGTYNIAVGFYALHGNTSGSANIAIGVTCLDTLTSGSGNVSIGQAAGNALLSGVNNVYLGNTAGQANSGAESSNIYLNSVGSSSESNTLRLGASTGIGSFQLSSTFISGINGVTLGGTPLAVVIDSITNQLGVATFPTGGSITIAGDTGSISGSSLTIYADVAALNCGSTVFFKNSGTISLLNVTDGNSNTIIGAQSGNSAITGSYNIGLGVSIFGNLTNGVGNIALGVNALTTTRSDVYLVAIGSNALSICNGGVNLVAVGGNALRSSVADLDNTAIGYSALSTLNRGSSNTVLGANAGLYLLTGSYNLMLGSLAGGSYSAAETSNILLNSTGTLGETNALHIGSSTGSGPQQLTTAYISGINNNSVANVLMVTIDSVTDQLGVLPVPSGGSVTIIGDSGSISGNPLTIYTDWASNHCGQTVLFTNSGTISTFNISDGNNNTLIGNGAGNGAISGTDNSAVGVFALSSITSGTANMAFGSRALLSCQNGSQNVAIGQSALSSVVGGSYNAVVGQNVMASLTSGNGNIAMGLIAGAYLISGSTNILLGFEAGLTLTTSESNNIFLNSNGVVGDSNTLRLGISTGTGSQQLNRAFISGINGVTVSSPMMVVINSSDQLGVQAIPSGGSLTINGDTGSASGSTLTLTALNGGDNSGSSVKFSASGSTIVLNVSDSNSNTLIGNGAGNITLTGHQNNAVGVGALAALTIGGNNTAIGYLALASCTSGANNIAIGLQALTALVSGTGSIAIGQLALSLSSADSSNIAIGYSTLGSLNGGTQNLCIGYGAGLLLGSGSNNTYIGYEAGGGNSGAESSNIYINTPGITGESNVLRIGKATGTAVQQLSKVFISGVNGVTSSNPLFVTINSVTDQLGVVAGGPGSIIIAADSGSATGTTINLTAVNGVDNAGSSVKFSASTSTVVLNVTDTNNNTLIGKGAGNATISGGSNTGLGNAVLSALTTGASSVAIGSNALTASTVDLQNVAIGVNSLEALNGGSDNVAVGFAAGVNLGTGSLNTYLGATAGQFNTGAESGNIYIGSAGTSAESHVLRIGQATGSSGSDLNAAFISGINGVTLSGVPKLVVINSSDQLGVSATLATAPPASSIATAAFTPLVLGTASANTLGYDILVNISIVGTPTTTASIVLGVGSTSTPTTNAVTGTLIGLATTSFCAVVPAGYYCLVNASGGGYTVTSITTQVCPL